MHSISLLIRIRNLFIQAGSAHFDLPDENRSPFEVNQSRGILSIIYKGLSEATSSLELEYIIILC